MICGRRILGFAVQGSIQIRRSLITDESLGLTSFDIFRRQRRESLEIPKDELWHRLDPQSNASARDQSSKFVFSEDLIQAVAIAETRDDVSRINRAITPFIKERTDGGQFRMLKRTTKTFAPLLMKLFHRLRYLDAAVNALMPNEDKDLEELFGSNLQCYQIGMDLLFESHQYQRILDVWDVYEKRRQTDGYPFNALPAFPRSLQVLILASCYKMDTPESFEYAMQFIDSGYEYNSSITNEQRQSQPVAFTRKGLALASALAANRNRTELAYELLSLIGHDVVDSYTAPRTLKCMLLIRLRRWHELINVFKRILESDLPSQAYQDREISIDAVKQVERALDSIDDQDIREKLKRSCGFLRRGGHVVDVTLDSLLCSPVQILATSTGRSMPMIADSQSIQMGSGSKSITPIASSIAPSSMADEKEANMWETSNVYDDDSSTMASLEKFQETEQKLKKFQQRREKALSAVGKWIREEGPFEVDDDKSRR